MNHIKIQDDIAINASAAEVWTAIKDPAIHAEWHPFVTHISGAHELGAARKCEVTIGGTRGQTEERCAMYQEGREIAWRIEKDSTGFSRMVSEWTGGFRLEQVDSHTTRVTAVSAFRPRNILVRLMMPFVKRKFHQTQQAILQGLKQFVEKR